MSKSYIIFDGRIGENDGDDDDDIVDDNIKDSQTCLMPTERHSIIYGYDVENKFQILPSRENKNTRVNIATHLNAINFRHAEKTFNHHRHHRCHSHDFGAADAHRQFLHGPKTDTIHRR